METVNIYASKTLYEAPGGALILWGNSVGQMLFSDQHFCIPDPEERFVGICDFLADGGTRTQRNKKLICRHEHADAVRRLPSVRILKFFGGRLHWKQMDQGVARSTVENV